MKFAVVMDLHETTPPLIMAYCVIWQANHVHMKLGRAMVNSQTPWSPLYRTQALKTFGLNYKTLHSQKYLPVSGLLHEIRLIYYIISGIFHIFVDI